jgi:gamma-glutamylcyclotransferase (GGCT)/AIG2-like uncharacterized protein YtfP|tara:strand:+ start:56 stop:388 length:333 start_codon:yes stop_codon:yes gene_type:complete
MVNTITKVYKSWIATMSNDKLDNKFEVLQKRAEKIKREVYDIGQEYLKLINEFEENHNDGNGIIRDACWKERNRLEHHNDLSIDDYSREDNLEDFHFLDTSIENFRLNRE